jgi:tRNA(fMet)-specific endonuclease VapC
MSGSKVILDTCIVSYLMKQNRPEKALYTPHVEGKLLAISFITVGEMYFGAEKARWGEQKRQKLETTLRNFVVIPYDHEIARCYGRLVSERHRNGRPIAPNDAWIAACTVRHSAPLITHNPKDFVGISGLNIVTEHHDDTQENTR